MGTRSDRQAGALLDGDISEKQKKTLGRAVDLNETQLKFHLEETSHLWKEIAMVLEHGWKLFQYSIVFCFGFFAWIITHKTDIDPFQWSIIKWFPFLFSFMSLSVGVGLYSRVRHISIYFKDLESQLSGPALGWQRYLDRTNYSLTQRYFGRGASLTTLVIGMTWLILIATNVFIGYNL